MEPVIAACRRSDVCIFVVGTGMFDWDVKVRTSSAPLWGLSLTFFCSPALLLAMVLRRTAGPSATHLSPNAPNHRCPPQIAERSGTYPLVAPTVEGEDYDRKSLLLPGNQLDLIQVTPGGRTSFALRSGR